jgi:hypothetical protein
MICVARGLVLGVGLVRVVQKEHQTKSRAQGGSKTAQTDGVRRAWVGLGMYRLGQVGGISFGAWQNVAVAIGFACRSVFTAAPNTRTKAHIQTGPDHTKTDRHLPSAAAQEITL